MTRLRAIVFDSVQPAALARFWAEALGATIRTERHDDTVLLDPEGNEFCVVDV